MPKKRTLAEAAADWYMQGRPPPPQHQGPLGSPIPGVPTAPEPQKMDIEDFPCPGECGYCRTWTHQTHCCTGCSRGLDHTNNCERKIWKGAKRDASAVKVQALCCEILTG